MEKSGVYFFYSPPRPGVGKLSGPLVLLIRSSEDCYRAAQINHFIIMTAFIWPCPVMPGVPAGGTLGAVIHWLDFAEPGVLSVITLLLLWTHLQQWVGQKKRKVDSECRVFNTEWTTKYFFTEVRSKAVCLICQEAIAVLKEYNISCHFSTMHANYANNQSTQERTATAQRLAASLQAQQNTFQRQTAVQESSKKATYLLAFKLAKTSKPLSKGEFLKECMGETAGILWPESKDKFAYHAGQWLAVSS